MFRILVLLMLMSSMVFAKTNKTSVNLKKGTKDQTLHLFYDFAVQEYNYSNFGESKDLFEGILECTNKYPGCDFFLGKIYEEVAMFKDPIISKQFYLKAATSETLDINMRQKSYAALIRLTDDPEIAMNYASESYHLADSEISKKALIVAYHKKYDKTRDGVYLEKAEIVNRSMSITNPDFITSEVNDSSLVDNK